MFISALSIESANPHVRQFRFSHCRIARRRHRPRSHAAGARRAAAHRRNHAQPRLPLHRSAGRGGGISRHRQVDVGENDQALRGGRRHPARRLRAAERALSRQHRDHAAGGAALHLRSLCRRPAGAAGARRAEPDRRRAGARHRFRAGPRIDRRPVRLHGQGRDHRHRGARDAGRYPRQDRAPVRLLPASRRAAQATRQARAG